MPQISLAEAVLIVLAWYWPLTLLAALGLGLAAWRVRRRGWRIVLLLAALALCGPPVMRLLVLGDALR